jgi:hypothetical protein
MMRSDLLDSTPSAHNHDLPLMMNPCTVTIPHSLPSNLHKQLEMMMRGVQIKKKLED